MVSNGRGGRGKKLDEAERKKREELGKRAVLMIVRHFSPLKDPRVARTRRHPLINLLVMALCGVIAGADGWAQLALFAQEREEWFSTFLDMPHGAPSADTFRRVFCALRPQAFEACFRAWVQQLAQALNEEVVAIDGKSVRGALGKMGWPLHLVHVWATQQRLLLAQMACKGAPGEVGAILELLKLLDLKGAVVTVDANGCTPAIAQAVLDSGASYVLHLKGNRGPLHQHVQQLFASVREGPQGARGRAPSRRITQAHGRREVRCVWARQLRNRPRSASKWPQLRTAVMVRRERTLKGQTKVEWHYYLTNLPPKARKLARIIRKHWGVENGLHWSLDVAMAEDSRAIRHHNGAQNFALISRIALTALRREQEPKKVGAPSRRKLAGWSNNYLLSVLRAGITEV